MFRRRNTTTHLVIASSSSSSNGGIVEEESKEKEPTTTTTTTTTCDSTSTKLALICVENALSMGIRTKLLLCPRSSKQKEDKGNTTTNNNNNNNNNDNNNTITSDNEKNDEGEEEDDSGEDENEEDDDEEEPWYNPSESSTNSGGGNNKNSKLPFEYRKLAWLDQVTAQESAEARLWLKQFLKQQRQYDQSVFFASLKLREAPEVPPKLELPKHASTSLAAAFVIQSLLLNPCESLDGMSGLYDTLVNAGNAMLLEGPNMMDTVRTALTSSLTQTAGNVWLALSQLYNYCGSQKYKRRLVHRLAPCLIRPPNAALWCCKQQKDMAAICEITLLILEEASRIFRGRWKTSREFVPQKRKVFPSKSSLFPVDPDLNTHVSISIQSIFTHDWTIPTSTTASISGDSSARSKLSRGISAQKILSSSSTQISPPSTPNRLKTPPRSPSSPINTPTPLTTTTNINNTNNNTNNITTTTNNTNNSTHNHILLSPTSSSSNKLVAGAPLSPSSPSAIKLKQHSSNSSVSTISVSSSSTSSSQHYLKSLTSTSVERKRTVAACRALRSQIARFEADFSKLHGRPPKGPTERAPLATTYAQYREWKKAIRADAACRIQALLRGAHTRMQLRHRMPHFSPKSHNQAHPPKIPWELQIPDDNKQEQVEVVISPPKNESPPWNIAPPTGPTMRRSPRSSASVTSMENSFTDGSLGSQFDHVSLPELKRMKRDLKEQLKQYDKEFYNQHKRMPVKAEKEPIRHLYERYNGVKGRITLMEKGGRMELEALKMEKNNLHQMLRSYEKEFYKTHNRQVNSYTDIQPVASQYRRYKDIKKAIERITNANTSSSNNSSDIKSKSSSRG